MVWFLSLALLLVLGIYWSIDLHRRDPDAEPKAENDRLAELMQDDLEQIITPPETPAPERDADTIGDDIADAIAATRAERGDNAAAQATGDTDAVATSSEESHADEEFQAAMDADTTGDDTHDAEDISRDPAANGASAHGDEPLDFDAEEDGLVLVWDDTAGPEPKVSLTENRRDPALVDVLMDDEIVAQIPKDAGLTAEKIALVRLSSARTLGWAAA